MSQEDFAKQIAILESVNDQLRAEFQTLNLLLKEIGFEDGIQTLKTAAMELIERKNRLH